MADFNLAQYLFRHGQRLSSVLADGVFDIISNGVNAGALFGRDPLTGNAIGPSGTVVQFGAPGTVTENPTPITASRAIAASDFGAGLITINAAGAVALTVPLLATMGLSATPGKTRNIVFRILGGGIPTFAGAVAGVTINGTAGPTVVSPIGGAPVTYDMVVLEQTAVGADSWALLS